MNQGHLIKKVEQGSIGEELGIEIGDILLEVNGTRIQDIFDYQYLINDAYITMLIQKPDEEQWELEIEKELNEDIGIVFEQSLMDEYRSCKNQCVFCFIDQMPPGMRDTLYFKDDDARLSFLQGNYITLTNMSDKDMERIILYKLAPINISIHTMNPELRCKMLHNRFAGDALTKLDQLFAAEIEMNSQVVLCKGYNDGDELEKTIHDLIPFHPHMKSLSVVPVGMTKYREGLEPLESFTKEDSIQVLAIIHKWQDICIKNLGTRFVYASDEWYIVAGLPIPNVDYYEDFGQIENGVGMVRSFQDEFEEAFAEVEGDERQITISMVTGKLFAPYLGEMVSRIKERFPGLEARIYPIENEFFGKDITVTGLLTGQDIIHHLKGRELGDFILLPDSVLRSGEEVLLDDVTVKDMEIALQKRIHIVQSDGKSFVNGVLMLE